MKKKLLIVIVIIVTLFATGCYKQESALESVEVAVEETDAEEETSSLDAAEETSAQEVVSEPIKYFDSYKVPMDKDNLPDGVTEEVFEDGYVLAHKLMGIARELGEEMRFQGADGRTYMIKSNAVFSFITEMADAEKGEQGEENNSGETVTETVNTAVNNQSNSNKPGGSSTNSSSSNTNNTSSNSSSGGANGTASSGSSSNTTTSQGSSSSSSATTSGGSGASSSGSTSSSSGNSSSSSSNSGTASGSSPTPSQPAPHTHNYVPGVANFNTGDRIDACSCGATTNTRGTWIVDVPAREAEYYEEPIYETGSRYWIPRSDNPSVILWEGYSWDGVTADTCWAMITTLNCSEEGKKLQAEGKIYASNYMKGGASRIIGYETKLSRPAQEEVGHWEW